MNTVNNKNKNKKVYQFFSDSGHGWLKVTRTELQRLKIIDKISSCSYQKNGIVFLEEDGDCTLFVNAKKSIDGIEIKTKGIQSDKVSKIRNYPYFSYDLIDSSLKSIMDSEFGKSHIIISTIGGN